eukprot:COSAG01_NODE_5391_length_4291_cov_3.036021_4_plen_615_part_00
MGEVASAWTRGFQYHPMSSRFLQGVITLKHFDANSLEGGSPSDKGLARDSIDVNVTNYMLADTYFPAFKAPIRNAGALGVMCSYNSLQGIPTCLSPLLRNAREQWTGKKPWGGYVTSDSDSVDDATRTHHYTKSAAEASCKAIRDGGDDINSGDTYYRHLMQGVEQGLCTMADVDAALHNTLKLRFRLGLFESEKTRRTLPWHNLAADDVGTEAAAALNLQAASESLVLIKNSNNTLPLKVGRNIAVIGPHGNATRFMVSFSSGPVCADGSFDCVTSPFQAIKATNAGGRTMFEPGCGIVDWDTSQMDAAVEAAAAADVAVLGLGIGMLGCFAQHKNCWNDRGPYTEAEGHDRTSIDLPPVQRELASRVFAVRAGRPTVIFLLNGGAVSIAPELRQAAAVVECMYPSVQGGHALAAALFGHTNNWGRMVYTIYHAEFVNQSSMLEHDLRVPPGKTYRYYTHEPLVPFGFGLSLSKWKLGLVRTPTTSWTNATNSSISLSVRVTNTGPLRGDCVLMCFFRPIRLPTQPQNRLLKQLIDFDRQSNVSVAENRLVTFNLSSTSLAVTDEQGDRVLAPGDFQLRITDGSGVTAEIVVNVSISGPQKVLEAFPSKVAVK